MRVGILTLPLEGNYGGMLQAWALQTILERMGHEAMVIDYKQYHQSKFRSPWYKDIISYPYRFFKKYILGQRYIHIRTERYYRLAMEAQMINVQPFLDKYIKSFKVPSLQSIKEDDFDMIVVGSDQIWRVRYASFHVDANRIEDIFLAFTRGWKLCRVSYAPSFGTDKWEIPECKTAACAEALKLFDAVSVREESGVTLCKEKMGVEATHVLDPTLLLEKTDYLALISDSKTPGHQTASMMTYILDKSDETSNLVSIIASRSGLLPFETAAGQTVRYAGYDYSVNAPLETWLAGFRDADLIVTDSFHACAFSIIFRKPFVVVENKTRGCARIHSLLKMLHLENHLIASPADFTSAADYAITAETEEVLAQWLEKSWRFLKENVGKSEMKKN